MKILLFGATGRVGTAIVTKCLAKGYYVSAFIRNKNKLTIKSEHLSFIEGDLYDKDALLKLQQSDFDVAVNVIGADPLKPSTIFSDATSLVIKLFAGKEGKRYIAITGIAQMKKTFFGKIAIAILKLTPVKNAISDHQNAYNKISVSNIDWTLIGCPYIKDGPETGKYKQGLTFRGGFKTIHPGDIANAIVAEIGKNNIHKIIGTWY
jgi:putative NADH-flavin reductase